MLRCASVFRKRASTRRTACVWRGRIVGSTCGRRTPSRSSGSSPRRRPTPRPSSSWTKGGDYVRHRGVRGGAAGGRARARGPAAARVPRVRLGRARADRGRPDRGPQSRREDQRAREGAGREASRRPHGDCPHPLGHARRAQHRERPPAHRLRRYAGAGPQRHHRERRRAAHPATEARSRAPVRDRHGGAGGHAHFMLKEIMEQPESLRNTLRGRLLEEDGTARLGGLNIDDEQLLQVNRIVFTACGTSWHSALIGEYMMEELARIPSEVEYASEFRYRNPIVDERTLVVGISQSGETADTLAALREAKRRGARTLGLVNVVGSTIAREVDGGIYLHAGPEIGVASTKAFTSQIAALALLTLKMGRLRALSILQGREVVRALARLPELVTQVLSKARQIEQLADRLIRTQNVLYLGRGYNFPVALEGALKLKEISYIHAEGYPAAEMKHGPIALIDDLMPVVFIAPKDAVHQKVVSNVEEVKARGGRVIAIVTEGDTALAKLADHRIEIPETLDLLTPVLSVVPLQLLAYYIAVRRGCNVDQPRNLAKSVTVE